jgi:hypothetical protein
MSHRDQTKLSPIRFFDRRMYRGLGVSMARSCVINGMFTWPIPKKLANLSSHILFDVRVHEKAHQQVGGGPPEEMNKMHSSVGVSASPGNRQYEFAR